MNNSDEQELSIWLDLEETVINNWYDGLFISKVDRIKKFIQREYPQATSLNIWSFAIYNDDDVNEFERSGMKSSIEQLFKMTISEYPSVADIMKSISNNVDGYFTYDSMHEFMQFHGKLWSFLKFGLLRKNEKLVLIDDSVFHSVVKYNHLNVELQTFNVDYDIF